MKKDLLFALSFVSAAYLAVVTMTNVIAAPPEAPPLSPESRVALCSSSAACPLGERLKLIKEMQDRMAHALGAIRVECRKASYRDCIDNQNARLQQWRDANDGAQRLMQSIEAQSLNQEEPAAGGAAPPAPVQEEETWYEHWMHDVDE